MYFPSCIQIGVGCTQCIEQFVLSTVAPDTFGSVLCGLLATAIVQQSTRTERAQISINNKNYRSKEHVCKPAVYFIFGCWSRCLWNCRFLVTFLFFFSVHIMTVLIVSSTLHSTSSCCAAGVSLMQYSVSC